MNHRTSNHRGERGHGRDRWGAGARYGAREDRSQPGDRRPRGERGMQGAYAGEYEGRSYSERSGRRYGSPSRDEDWPDPSHDYRSGEYGGDYDGPGDERYSSEGNYPGVGNYQGVGGYPGGGYAGGGGYQGGAGYHGGPRRYSQGRDFEDGGHQRGYESVGLSGLRERFGGRDTYGDEYGGDYGGRGYGRSRSAGAGERQRSGGYGGSTSEDRSSVYGDERGVRGTVSGMMSGMTHESHRGRGPKNYTRSDERIREDISERLYEDEDIDASDITINVKDGVVTLEGTVHERWLKHRAEDMAEACPGVKDVDNRLHVSRNGDSAQSGTGSSAPGISGSAASGRGTSSGSQRVR